MIYSSYRLLKECFDKKKGAVISRRKKGGDSVNEINEYIRSTLYELKMVVSFLEEQENDFSVSDILNLYRSNRDNSFFFIYMRKLMIELKEEGRVGTANAYQSTLNRIIKFVGEDEMLCFDEITVKWLNSFIGWLQREKLAQNTINFYCRILRAVYNRACNEGVNGVSCESPFKKVTFNSVKTTKRAIDGITIKKIVNAKIDNNKRLELTRDVFLFSFYTRGMSFVDMAYLKYINIDGDMINYSRSKTGQPLKVRIVPPLRTIIEKYKNDSEYVLPILKSRSRSLYNQYRCGLRKFNNQLKQLSLELKLQLPLTSYVARHSWATLARKSGAPVSIISESLGHSSEKITYTYLAALDQSVVDSVNQRLSDIYA